MQRKSTYQPWSQRQKKLKVLGSKDMLDISHPTIESQGGELRFANGDVNCSQAKSSRKTPKMKAVKLKPAVADMVAGFSGSLARRAGTKEKERREELAAAVIEKRRALVARQFTSPIIGPSNPGEQTSEAHRQSGGEASQEHHVEDVGKTTLLDPGMYAHLHVCSIRECAEEISVHNLI